MSGIEYENRPTDEQIAEYKTVVEEYLSAQRLTIEIRILTQPYESSFSINGDETKTRHWIDSIKISTPEVKELEIHMLEPGIEFDSRWKEKAWSSASHIQGELYTHLKKPPPPGQTSNAFESIFQYFRRLFNPR